MAGDGVRIEIYARLVNSGYWWCTVERYFRAIRRNWTSSIPAIIPPRFFGKRVPSIRCLVNQNFVSIIFLFLSLFLCR